MKSKRGTYISELNDNIHYRKQDSEKEFQLLTSRRSDSSGPERIPAGVPEVNLQFVEDCLAFNRNTQGIQLPEETDQAAFLLPICHRQSKLIVTAGGVNRKLS